MKISLAHQLILYLALSSSILSLNADQTAPLIVEYVPEFKVTANDLNNAITSDFNKMTIGAVKTSYVQITSSSFSLSYKGNANVTYVTPLKIQVNNDSFIVSTNFTAVVAHLLRKKKYQCTSSSADILISYIKEVDLETGAIDFSAFKNSFSSTSFKTATCTPKPNSTDLSRINEALTNTQSSSIYLELKKNFDKMEGVFIKNSKTQHLSQVFTENPYVYEYYDKFKANVNVSTIDVKKYGEKGIINMITGTIQGTTHIPTSAPPAQQNYTLFYSRQFIENFLDYSVENYQGWKMIKADKTLRTRIFRFKLVDYEYIVPGVLKQYPQLYMADTQISCQIDSYNNLEIVTGEGIKLNIKWSCFASVQVSAGKNYQFLNFQPTINYDVTVKVDGEDYLTIYQKPKNVIDLNFNIIDGKIIEEPYLVKQFIQQALFEYATYPIGHRLKVKAGSNQVKLIKTGVWIG